MRHDPGLRPEEVRVKEISEFGVSRRKRTYRTAAGREFPASVAISGVGVRQNRMWLVRIADLSESAASTTPSG